MKTRNATTIDDLLKKAVAYQRAGDLDSAELLYAKVFRREPSNADALHMQGMIDFEKGKIESAIVRIEAAIASDPTFAGFYRSLGKVKKSIGRNNDALCVYQKAFSIDPADVSSLHEIAAINHQMEQLETAKTAYKRCLQLQPNHESAYCNLGLIYRSQKRYHQAISCFQKALAFNPNLLSARSNLAITLKDDGQYSSALGEIEKVAKDAPKDPNGHYHMGLIHAEMGNTAEAIAAYEKAIACKPDFVQSYNNLGIVLQAFGRTKEAIRCFQKAIQLKPTNYRAYYNLGALYKYHEQYADAVDCLKTALTINPDFYLAKNELAAYRRDICQWPTEETGDYHYALETNNTPGSIQQLCKEMFPELSSDYLKLVFASETSRSQQVEKRLAPLLPRLGHNHNAFRKDKIVVGYMSNNFRNHPTAHLICDLFAIHDRKRFEIHCYSYGEDDRSIYRLEIEKNSDRFVDLYNVGILESASIIHRNKTQILIDLNGYTACSRTDICGFRPAPIQVRYLGAAKTTGASFFDYLIGDPIVTPKKQDSFYSENLVFMPHSYQVNSRPRLGKPINLTRNDFLLPDNGLVFCSFATSYKIDPELFISWMRILERTPNSYLWLLKRDAAVEANLKSVASAFGINPHRLRFSEPCPKPVHLIRLSLADLCLDTRAVNGAATTSDALWAGVPVVTIQGGHFASRMSASILSAVGLSELITDDLRQYEELAVALAADREQLQALRAKLETNTRTYPLFDTGRFVRNLENAFEQMWEIYKAGEPPRHIQVKDCGPSEDTQAI